MPDLNSNPHAPVGPFGPGLNVDKSFGNSILFVMQKEKTIFGLRTSDKQQQQKRRQYWYTKAQLE